MDAKALAKSKRSHSLHLNKKHNPHHASKSSSTGSGTSAGDKKPAGKQVKEKPASKLPSNWDRYDEEYASDSETAPQKGSSKATDVVMPKSKGADYLYLLSEAKEQLQYSSECFSLCDDFLDDFYQGIGALLSTKGKSKLSWIEEDNFAMEDKAPAPSKASFLSLDLHALSEQLERASLSERLFIEPDRLPLELCTQESLAADEDKNKGSLASCKGSTAESDSSSLDSPSVFASNQNRCNESPNSWSAFKDEVGKSEGPEPNDFPTMHMSSVAKKQSAFKVVAAEAELDMLLISSDTEILGSTNVIDQSSWPYSVVQAKTAAPLSETSSIDEGSTQYKKDHHLTKHMNLDDTLNDLLRETSGVSSSNEGLQSDDVNTRGGPASQPVPKSKIMDDFDSWFDTL